jgi:hypothetical protein
MWVCGQVVEKNEAAPASFFLNRLVQVDVESVVNPDGYPQNPSATAYPHAVG